VRCLWCCEMSMVLWAVHGVVRCLWCCEMSIVLWDVYGVVRCLWCCEMSMVLYIRCLWGCEMSMALQDVYCVARCLWCCKMSTGLRDVYGVANLSWLQLNKKIEAVAWQPLFENKYWPRLVACSNEHRLVVTAMEILIFGRTKLCFCGEESIRKKKPA
jgi:hypothetical protein